MSTNKFRFAVFAEIYHGSCKKNPYSTKKSLCTGMSQVSYLHVIQIKISPERSNIMNFYKRSYQPILRYLYIKAIKRRGKISLHRHIQSMLFRNFQVYKFWQCYHVGDSIEAVLFRYTNERVFHQLA